MFYIYLHQSTNSLILAVLFAQTLFLNYMITILTSQKYGEIEIWSEDDWLHDIYL